MKIRIKFSKLGHLKYIGHLDIMRCFQKVMRRADVDIAYSAGFSPHQIMSFASPLGLGLTSEGEYVDIEVLSTGSSQEMIRRINEAMVEGMQALSYVKLPDKAKTAMSVVAAADYRVTFTVPIPREIQEQFQEFLSGDSIVITKMTKKTKKAKKAKKMKLTKDQVAEVENGKEMDIRPLIYQTSWEENSLVLQLSAGSAANLKPEQVVEAFFAFCGIAPEQFPYHLHRLELYADLAQEGEPRKLIPLEGMGEVIV